MPNSAAPLPEWPAALEALCGLCGALAGSGAELYLVGGAVRDWLRGQRNHDLDLLIRHPGLDAGQLEALLRERLAPAPALQVGESFAVYKVKWAGEWLDLALPTVREGSSWHTDPRLPLEADLGRRDFTVNAMALELCSAAPRLHDPFGGQADAAAGRLRAVGDAGARLSEDPLRLLRAARFTARGFTPEAELTAAARALAPRLASAASERLWAEWQQLFQSPQSARGLRWLAEVGALQVIIPAWAEVDGLEQHNPHHSETVSEHILSVVAALDGMDATPLTKQAGFFHDIGKGRTRTLETGSDGRLRGHFYGHEDAGAELTRQSLRALRADGDSIRCLGQLVALHMHPGQAATRPAARRLVAAAGNLLEPLLTLHAADRSAHSGEDMAAVRARQDFIRGAAQELPPAFSQQLLALGGRELLALGFTPREVGAAKRWLTEQVLEGRVPNEHGPLLALLQAEYLPAQYLSAQN